jgi:hypothetical protein
MSIVAYNLDTCDLQKLRARFPPKYIEIVQPHCTAYLGKQVPTDMPKHAKGRVYARVDDFEGVEVLLISVEEQERRPDGNLFHITWSLTADRKPRESNYIIKRCQHEALSEHIEISLLLSKI